MSIVIKDRERGIERKSEDVISRMIFLEFLILPHIAQQDNVFEEPLIDSPPYNHGGCSR